jgi:hypothetical protein
MVKPKIILDIAEKAFPKASEKVKLFLKKHMMICASICQKTLHLKQLKKKQEIKLK